MEKESQGEGRPPNNSDIVPGFDYMQNDNLIIRLARAEGAPDCIVISLMGYIDAYNSRFFQKQIERVMESGFKNLIFDCAKLTYLASIGFGAFMLFFKALKPKGGNIVILRLQPRVYEVFELLGYSQFFPIKDSVEDAVNFLADLEGASSHGVFPMSFSCPICSKRLKAPKPGRFHCTECKTALVIGSDGQVSLG